MTCCQSGTGRCSETITSVWPADGVQPGAELLGVGDRGAQRRHLDFAGQVDDDLLPDRAAETVGEVVDLVHDHEAKVVQGVGVGVQHVPEHLGGHHHHRGVAVDAGVTGQQPDVFAAPYFSASSEYFWLLRALMGVV